MGEIARFIGNLASDVLIGYCIPCRRSDVKRSDKFKCLGRMTSKLAGLVWCKISAPLIYPLWYIFRRRITERIHRGTTWEEIKAHIDANETAEAKAKLKANGRFLYWMWTYGDIDDPLGRGGLPKNYKGGENTFWNRYRYSALRNPRFNYNYMELKTGVIVEAVESIDTRDFGVWHVSDGIGDSPDGVYFKWMRDAGDRWYFLYEDNNSKHIFYFGYVGLRNDVGRVGRLEASLRKTKSTYQVALG